MTYVEARNTRADILFGGEAQPGEIWEQALTRMYNDHFGFDKTTGPNRRRSVASEQHFPGGSTWHVQMGISLGQQQMSLDDLMVVSVTET